MRIIITFFVILLLITGILAFAVFNLNGLVNKNKGIVLKEIESKTERKVDVGEIGVNIWGGLGLALSDFEIKDDPEFSDGNFVEAESLVVGVKLLPLFKNDFQIKKFILEKPVIRIIRNKKGVYNYSGLTGKTEKETTGSEETEFYIGVADITDGKVYYEDRKYNTKLDFSKIDFSSRGIEKNKPLSFDLEMAVLSDKKNIKAGGSVGPLGESESIDKVPLDLKVDIDSVNFAELKKNFPQINEFIPPGLGLNGPLKTSFTASGTGSQILINDLSFNSAVFGSRSPNLNVSGSLGPVSSGNNGDINMDLNFSLDPVDFENLRKFKQVGDSLPKELGGKGPLKLKGNVSGAGDNLSLSSVVFDATETELSYSDTFLKEKDTVFTVATDSFISKEAVDFKTLNIVLNKLKADVKGRMGLGENAAYDLKIVSGNADLASVSENIVSLKDYNLNGNMDIDLALKGTSEKPNIFGIAKLKDLGASPAELAKPISGLNGTVNFTGSGATLDKTVFYIGSSKLYLDANITNFSPLTGSYDLTSDEIHLTDLSKTAGKNEIFKDVKVAGKIKADGTQTADISSSNGKVSKVSYKKLNGKATMKDGVIDFNNFNFDFLNAKFNSNGTFDISGDVPKFDMSTNLTGVSVTDLVATFLDPREYPIVGISTLQLALKGAGKGWDTISKTLSGTGRLEIREGGIRNLNIADSVLKGITGIGGLTDFISDNTKNKHPEVFKSRDTNFYKISTPIEIHDGKVNMENINLQTKDYVVKGKGSIGLAGGMNLNCLLSLSDDLSDDLVGDQQMLKYLKNKKGNMEIPFTLDETLTPRPDVNYLNETVQRAAREKTEEQIKKKLFESLGGKDDEEEKQQLAPGENPAEDSKKKKKGGIDGLIEEGLDKVFSF